MNTPKSHLRTFEGNAKAFHYAIIVSRFNDQVTSKLLEGARHCFQRHKVPQNQIKIVQCPGAFELPQVANRLALLKKYDAIICLGAVIRGETPHFEYVCSETARGVQNVALQHNIPVVFGVLTTDTEAQALDRVGGVHGHKGWDAALTAMEMAELFRSLKKSAR